MLDSVPDTHRPSAAAANPSKSWVITGSILLGLLIVIILIIWRAYSSPKDTTRPFKTGDYVRVINTVTWDPNGSEQGRVFEKMVKTTGQIVDSGTNHRFGVKLGQFKYHVRFPDKGDAYLSIWI